MKIQLKKLQEGVCPYCGSLEIFTDGFVADENEDGSLMSGHYQMICGDCVKRFNACYDFVFIGCTLTDGDGKFIKKGTQIETEA